MTLETVAITCTEEFWNAFMKKSLGGAHLVA